MPARDWQLRIEDMIEAIRRVQSYTAGMDQPAFSSDTKTVDAVVRNLEVIGEAARHIPASVEQKYPDIAWAEMRAMRNVLMHEYFGVNIGILWQTIVHDLSDVLPLLERILADGIQP